VLELSGLGAVDGLEGLHIAGLYGLQILVAATGEVETTVDDRTRAAVQAVRDELPALLADAPPGVHLEDKDIALVVHTRPAADPQAALDQLLPAIRELADRHGLIHEPGRFAAEIRPGGSDKGATLLRLVDAGPIRDPRSIWDAGFVRNARSSGPIRAVLYAGDDTGDLPALRAVPGLRERGVAAVGVAVTQEGTDPEVPAAADLTVDGPAGLRDLLGALLA
jgi:trehalose 6-phosphate phosphatase